MGFLSLVQHCPLECGGGDKGVHVGESELVSVLMAANEHGQPRSLWLVDKR